MANETGAITKIQLKTKTSTKSLSDIDLDLGEVLVDKANKKVIIGGTAHDGDVKNKADNGGNIILGASKTELGTASNNSVNITHKDAAGDSSYTLKTEGATLTKSGNTIKINANYTLDIEHDDAASETKITLTSPDGSSTTGSIADPDWDTKVLNRPVVHWVGDDIEDSNKSSVIESISSDDFSYKDGKDEKDLHHYDICINKQKIGNTNHYEHIVYIYYENKGWQRLDFEYNANNVIMPQDLQLAGDYTRVGNITKESTQTTSVLQCEGMSIYATLDKIFNIREIPIITQPSYSFTPSYTTDTRTNEIGSYITSIGGSYSFSNGSYSRGRINSSGTFESSTSADCTPFYSTSVTLPDYITTTSSLSSPVISIQSTSNNDGKGIQITSLESTKYAGLSTKCSWSDSAYFPADSQHNEYYDDKNKNKQKDAGEELNIKASYSSINKAIYVTGVRYHFYGAKDYQSTENSASIRRCTPTTDSSFSISLNSNTKRVIIAAYNKTLTSVKDVNDSNSEIKGSFSYTTISVAGANGYMPVSYNVYTLDFAGAYGQTNTYKVTLG